MTRLWLAAALIAWAPPVFAQNGPPSPPPETTVDASRGGVTIASGVNSLTIGARAQVRWTVDDRDAFDADATGPGAGRADGVSSAFEVPRLRLTLSGGVFRPWMKYSFQFELGRTSSDGASKIKDAILEIRPTGRSYAVQVGQFKAPFGLQQITSSGRLQFVDRAITDAKFNPGRDMGVMVSGTVAQRKVGYDVGLFNGAGESNPQDTRAHLWTVRGYVNPYGRYAPSESAIDAGDRAVLHVGAAVRGGKPIRGRTPSGVFEEVDNQTAFNLEFAYKRPRYYTTAEYFWMRDEQRIPIMGPDIRSRGYHAQAGFTPVPRKIDVGIRHARIVADTRVDDSAISELRGVFGYFWEAHNLKLQADVGQTGYGASFIELSPRARQGLPSLGRRFATGRDYTDTQLRVQLQLAF